MVTVLPTRDTVISDEVVFHRVKGPRPGARRRSMPSHRKCLRNSPVLPGDGRNHPPVHRKSPPRRLTDYRRKRNRRDIHPIKFAWEYLT